MTTNSDNGEWLLTLQQATAVDLLVVGRNVTDVAEELGVARQTVSAWVNQHVGFQAALNQRREELWSAMTDRLQGLLPKALDVLERTIDDHGPRSLDAALHVMRAAGLFSARPAIGPTDPQELELAAREREERRQLRAMLKMPV